MTCPMSGKFTDSGNLTPESGLLSKHHNDVASRHLHTMLPKVREAKEFTSGL